MTNHKVGWHIGNIMPFDDGQKSVIRAVPPCCVTFIAGEGFWPEHMLEVGGFRLRVQPYAGGIVVCEVGKWEQVTHLEW